MDGRRPCSGPPCVSGERHGGSGQQASVLPGVDPTRGRRSAVEHACHGVLDGIAGLPAAQELQMHVGRQPVGVHGPVGRGKALRDELPAV